jgi:hypothetical protein
VWTKSANIDLLSYLDETQAESLAIEMIASYGMAVGQSTFETCVWIGRFIERWRVVQYPRNIRPRLSEVRRVTRKQVLVHLCNSAKGNDSTLRHALIDRYGGKEKAIGKKAMPGPLYGMNEHTRAALGVAITASET